MLPAEHTTDLWDELGHTDRPVAVYGMGNGADKLMDRLSALGVPVCCVCASDGFVRGQSFRGFRVISLSEVGARFGRCYLLVAFGSRLSEVIDAIDALQKDFDVRIPDMPVTDTVFFDRTFYADNRDALCRAHDLLADAHSRALFCSLVRYKLSGELATLMQNTSPKEDVYRLLGRDVRSMLDLGAYRGDTAAEAMRYFPTLSHITAVEADRRSFQKLASFAAGCEGVAVEAVFAAVGETDGHAVFFGAGNRNSSLGATSHEYREDTVPLVTVDTLMHRRTVDYIKYDVEGAELAALRGSLMTIRTCRPILRVAAYHRSEDLFRLILFVAEHAPFYDLYLRRTPCIPAWETDLICIPKER